MECRRLVRILECIVREAHRITADILSNESISVIQEKLLNSLQNDMITELMDSNLNPFFVRIQELTHETSENDGTEEYIPEINIPLFAHF